MEITVPNEARRPLSAGSAKKANATFDFLDACADENLSGVKRALENGAYWRLDHDKPLRVAVATGKLQLCKLLVEKTSHDIFSRDVVNASLLISALKSPSPRIAEYLLTRVASTRDTELIDDLLMTSAVCEGCFDDDSRPTYFSNIADWCRTQRKLRYRFKRGLLRLIRRGYEQLSFLLK